MAELSEPIEAVTSTVKKLSPRWGDFAFSVTLAMTQFYVYVNLSSTLIGFSDKVALFYILFPMVLLGYVKVAQDDFAKLKLWKMALMGCIGFFLTWVVVLFLFGLGLGVQFGTVPTEEIVAILVTQILFVACSEEIIFRFVLPRYVGSKFPQGGWARTLGILVISQGMFAMFHMAAYQGSISSLLIAWVMGCIWYLLSVWRPFKMQEPLGIGFTIGSHAAYNLTIIGVLAGASHWITIA